MSEKNFSSFGDLETLIAEIVNKISGKVDKVTGKGLSTNDYTTADKNKVDALKSASTKDVPSSGNASSTQVVMGNDTRLSDSRNAKDVYAWAKASTKPSYTASEVGAIATTAKGAANGVAELDSAGKVPSSQLPSYVDDVLEYSSMSAFPATGEAGKIYVAKDTNKTYRWSGTAYVEISPSLALGETSSTAYRGDRGKTAYDHSQLTSGNPHNVTKSNVGLGNVTNDAQVKGLASGTTSGHVVTWGSDGYTVGDSGFTIGKSVPSNAVFTDNNNRKSFYGTCDTAAATAKKVVTLSDSAGWELKAGTIVGVKFTNTNTASSCTLNVNGTGDKSIWYNTSVYAGNSTQICGAANIIIFYMYDGTNWVWINMSKMDGNTDIRPSAYCDTAAATAAKVASCTGYSLKDKSWLHVDIVYANTSATALTLNVNGRGAKSIYINGSASSTTNYTLPAGTYLVYYASNIYYFRTDGKLTADITGDSATVNGKTVGVNVPSDAKFTDTTYSEMSLAELKTGTATNLRTLKSSVLNPAIKMYCPHYATCTSQAANQKKAVVVADANFQLYTGCIIAVKFDANNTYSATAAAPVMFNVNSTGDKEVRGNAVNAATTGTATNIFGTGNRIISYQYDGTYWVKIGQSWDDNSTYNPQVLGFGYGTCDTAAATAAKAVTLSGYALVNNGIVSVKFTYDVPASATMNINSKGAKSIYYHGAAITAGIIKAGDIATFMYYNNIYHLIAVDSDHPIEITWDAWNALSSSQRAGKHYIITDVPDATGSLDCELMDLLWKNSNPTAAFGEQDVSLDLTGYDFVVIFTSMGNDEQFTAISRVPKSGETDVWSKVINAWNTGTTTYVLRREYKVYTNKIHFNAAINTDGSTSSTHHIPYEIYGIKKSVSFDFSAIAHDVKTDAANCMLSDGVTSVEDKIGNIFFVEKNVSNVSVSTVWGSLYLAQLTVDISSLGLTNAPDVVSVELSTTGGDIALCVAANINKNNITVFMLRGVSGTVNGKIMLMLKSNG